MREGTPRAGRLGVAVAGFALASVVLLAPCGARVGSADPIDEVPQGTMLGKENWEIAKGHLPDEILEFYKRGDYSNPIMHLGVMGKTVVDPRIDELSAQNEGKFDIDANGTVVDKATGQRPKVITGRPFPKLDPSDPKAGQKAIWNWFYTLYWEGSFHTQSPVNWVSREGPVRRISTDVYFKYYDGNPPEFQEKIGDNPLNILSRTIGVVRQPADVNGVVSLNWRYRDGDKDDNAWSYVPALRRVRPVNPSNRSDGLLGSDISQDDGPYFDAKPEDFTYKLIGEGKILAHFDRMALEKGSPLQKIEPDDEVAELIPSSSTGWKLTVPDVPAIAAQDPSWKQGEGLVAWAPAQIALVPRPVWIVEATPKNPYYLYGKQVMYFDKESFRGYWKNKYDWKSNALSNWAPPAMPVMKVDGPPGYMRTGGGGNVAYAVNYKLDRATVTGMPIAPTQYYVEIDDKIYETDRMIRAGK